MEILGLSHMAVALIIAVAGTALYHLRNYPKGEFDARKIVDSRLAIFATGVTAAYASLPQIAAGQTPEIQLGVIMAEIGGIAGFSFIAKKGNDKRVARKRAKQAAELAEEELYDKEPRVKREQLDPPVLGPADSWVQTNLKHKKGLGAYLDYGQAYLWIRLVDAQTFVTALLLDPKKNIIQIDQSVDNSATGDAGTGKISQVEIIRLELFGKSGKPLPRGLYEIRIAGDRGTSYSVGSTSKFHIL